MRVSHAAVVVVVAVAARRRHGHGRECPELVPQLQEQGWHGGEGVWERGVGGVATEERR